jgi:hypothetical protein
MIFKDGLNTNLNISCITMGLEVQHHLDGGGGGGGRDSKKAIFEPLNIFLKQGAKMILLP